MTVAISDVIAFGAFVLALISTIQGLSISRRQVKYEKKQDELNDFLLAKERNEVLENKRADIFANTINIGSNDHKIRICNRGKGCARNIRFECVEPIKWMIIDNLFPFEIMEPGTSVDLPMSAAFGMGPSQKVRIIWDDDSVKDYQKEFVLTL